MFCFAFRNQLFYFITAFLTCQALFYFYFAIAYRDNFLTISHSQVFVNNLFKVFWTFYFVLFFKKRRKRDLNPRAGCPTYTLSRGASSASWVFLRIHNFLMMPLSRHTCPSDACSIILKHITHVKSFFTYFWTFLHVFLQKKDALTARP